MKKSDVVIKSSFDWVKNEKQLFNSQYSMMIHKICLIGAISGLKDSANRLIFTAGSIR